MIATATYKGDDLWVSFTCQMERCDNGVPRSPVWWEPDPATIEIADLEMLGVSLDPKALPKELVDAIYDLVGDLEWESEIE
jgi:hypothetical protein